MTDERLAELERLSDAASPPKWFWADDDPNCDGCPPHTLDSREAGDIGAFWHKPDALFCAAARTAVPELIAEVRRLRAELGKAV